MEISLDLVVKVKGKTPLENGRLRGAAFSALSAGRATFLQSDFLAWRQMDLQDTQVQPDQEEEERRRTDFEQSLGIFHADPAAVRLPPPPSPPQKRRKF